MVREDNNTGRVTAVICSREDGSYAKYTGSKAVVLATGDVSYNDEYINEFAPIANKVMTRLCSDQATPATAITWPHGLAAPSRTARGPR